MDERTRARIRAKKDARHAHTTAPWFNLPPGYVPMTTIFRTNGKVETFPTRRSLTSESNRNLVP